MIVGSLFNLRRHGIRLELHPPRGQPLTLPGCDGRAAPERQPEGDEHGCGQSTRSATHSPEGQQEARLWDFRAFQSDAGLRDPDRASRADPYASRVPCEMRTPPLVLLLCACGSRTTPAGTTDSSGRAREAMAECRQAFADVAAASDIAAAVPMIFESCADLHAAASCRDAWRTAARVRAEMRISVAAAGCQRAYCPALPEPRPDLCGRTVASMQPSDLGPAWAQFERVVLERELGTPGRALGDALARMATPIVVPVPPSPEPPPEGATVTLTVGLSTTAPGHVFIEGPGRRRVELAGQADAAAIEAAVRPLVAGADGVVLAADERLPYEVVVKVIDGVRRAGVTRFSISVAP